jgi:hypothetical protein
MLYFRKQCHQISSAPLVWLASTGGQMLSIKITIEQSVFVGQVILDCVVRMTGVINNARALGIHHRKQKLVKGECILVIDPLLHISIQ